MPRRWHESKHKKNNCGGWKLNEFENNAADENNIYIQHSHDRSEEADRQKEDADQATHRRRFQSHRLDGQLRGGAR